MRNKKEKKWERWIVIVKFVSKTSHSASEGKKEIAIIVLSLSCFFYFG